MKGENAVMKAVGKRIQYYRKARGYTQEQFAEMIDLSTNYLSDVERGKSAPRIDKLVLIINTLECSADVINTGFQVRSTRLSEEIEELSPKEKDTAFTILKASARKVSATPAERVMWNAIRQMIRESDVCIFYYDENYLPSRRKSSRRDICDYQPKSGAAVAYAYAVQKKKRIYNLCEK